jgi:hypothetical protein
MMVSVSVSAIAMGRDHSSGSYGSAPAPTQQCRSCVAVDVVVAATSSFTVLMMMKV